MVKKKKSRFVIIGIALVLIFIGVRVTNAILQSFVRQVPDGTYYRIGAKPGSDTANLDTSYKLVIKGNQVTMDFDGEHGNYRIDRKTKKIIGDDKQYNYSYSPMEFFSISEDGASLKFYQFARKNSRLYEDIQNGEITYETGTTD